MNSMKALSSMALVALAHAQSPPELPTLPTQFEAVIEANIINRNYTIHMHEWFASKNKAARTDIYSARSHDSTTSVYDFAKNHYFHIDQRSGCKWGDTNHISGRAFGVDSSGSSGPHLTTSEQYFRFGANMTEKYAGRKTVRSILADHWIATMNRGNSTMTLDYYFSVPEWKLPQTGSTRVPLRLRLTGTRLVTSFTNRTCGAQCHHSRPCWMKCRTLLPKDKWYNHTYDHIYDYTAFRVGAPEASVFEKPCGIVCKSTNQTWNPMTLPPIGCPGRCDHEVSKGKGRGGGGRGGDHGAHQKRNHTKHAKPSPPPPGTPPKLATEFRLVAEVTTLKIPGYMADQYPANSTFQMHEWVSKSQDRARIDFYMPNKDETSSSVYDIKNNLYEHHTNERASCMWGDMRHIAGDQGMSQWMIDSGTKNPHVTSAEKLFFFGGKTNSGKNITEKYMGATSVRGITTDHWIAGPITDTYTEGTTTMSYTVKTDHYFSVPEWSSPEAGGRQIPVRMRMVGTTINTTTNLSTGEFEQVFDFTSFHVGTPHADVFAIPCGAVCNSTNTTWNSQQKKGAACVTQKCAAPPAPPAPNATADSITAAITISASIADIQVGTVERALFEGSFKKDMAKALGGIAPNRIVIMSVASGSVSVTLHSSPYHDRAHRAGV